jgi:SAM-dependent methyltransferase
MKLLSDAELERSAVVANCRMNRERTLRGSNGYGREIRLDPMEFFETFQESGRQPAWLDLCCGTGKALIEAAIEARERKWELDIVGVDLAGMFDPVDRSGDQLKLIEASLDTWRPDRTFELITCIHGLHYIGDKLGLIARVISWLSEDGFFAANLDIRNFEISGSSSAGRQIAKEFKRNGLVYDLRRKLLTCRGPKNVQFRYQYEGADDQAGPNYTGQPAVNSYYRLVESI